MLLESGKNLINESAKSFVLLCSTFRESTFAPPTGGGQQSIIDGKMVHITVCREWEVS
jgi:hypothetical protein